MRVRGLVIAGTHTNARATMTRFVRDVLGLTPTDVPGIDGDVFEVADGSTFIIAATDEAAGERTVGFLVEDLDTAVGELRAAGADVDDVSINERFRYVHFRAPDGKLYELVERRGD